VGLDVDCQCLLIGMQSMEIKTSTTQFKTTFTQCLTSSTHIVPPRTHRQHPYRCQCTWRLQAPKITNQYRVCRAQARYRHTLPFLRCNSLRPVAIWRAPVARSKENQSTVTKTSINQTYLMDDRRRWHLH